MPTHKYLKATVTSNGSTKLHNMKLSEAYRLSKMAQQNDKIVIRIAYCSPKQYKSIFE